MVACYRKRRELAIAGSRSDARVADAKAADAGAADVRVGSGRAGDTFDAKGWLAHTTGEMRESFARNRRVMSFGEYFALFGADSARQVRSAAQYLRDVFDHFGTETVRTPRGGS